MNKRMSNKTRAWQQLDKAAVALANAKEAMNLAGISTSEITAAQNAIGDAQKRFGTADLFIDYLFHGAR